MVLTPLANFPLRAEENTQSPKQGTKCEVYFYHLFLKVLHWTLEMRLWQPWEIIFAGKPMCSFNDRRLSFKQFCFQKIFWKWSSAQVGYGFENNALLFCWKSKFFLLKDENWLKKHIFQVNFTIFFLSARWSVVWHTWLNNFAKRQRNHWNSKNDNRKRNLFRKRIFFHRNFSLEARFFVGWILKKTLWQRDPFFHPKIRRRLKSCSILRNKCFPSKPWKDKQIAVLTNNAVIFC